MSTPGDSSIVPEMGPDRHPKRTKPLLRLAIALVITFASTNSQSQQLDVTGIHADRSRCSIESLNVGRAYLESCFQGYANMGQEVRYVLIQNGKHVCGHFSSCVGNNCNHVYAGETVGELNGNRLTLYSATGHIENGTPEIGEFIVSSAGALLVPQTGQPALTKIARTLSDDTQRRRCLPNYKQPVQIKNYELDIKGSRPKQLSFSDKLEKPVFHAPKTKTAVLTSKSKDFTLNDLPRNRDNMVPRNVLIINQSKLI